MFIMIFNLNVYYADIMSLSRFQPSSWALKPEKTTFAANGWSNKDIDPVPPRLRTWT